MQKVRFITAVQIIILLYLVITGKSVNAKSSDPKLISAESLNKGIKINHSPFKAMKTSFKYNEVVRY